MTAHDDERLYQLISNHLAYTGSERAKTILDNWADYRPIIPESDAGRVSPRARGDGADEDGAGSRVACRTDWQEPRSALRTATWLE